MCIERIIKRKDGKIIMKPRLWPRPFRIRQQAAIKDKSEVRDQGWGWGWGWLVSLSECVGSNLLKYCNMSEVRWIK